MSTFTARYHSQCGTCDGHISPGDTAQCPQCPNPKRRP